MAMIENDDWICPNGLDAMHVTLPDLSTFVKVKVELSDDKDCCIVLLVPTN
jgi:hypothetical protein